MAGALYLWIMLAFFTGAAALILLFTLLLYAGHRLEQKHTGATHRFLEKPADPPAPTIPMPPNPPQPPAD